MEGIEVPKFSQYMQGQEVVPGDHRPIQEGQNMEPEDVLHLQRSIDAQREAYEDQQTALAEQQRQQQNPFAVSQYGGNMPDAPISYGGGMAEQLLNDNEVPKYIKKKYWYIFHKDNILTFLDEERKKSKLLNIDINKIDILNSIPYYDYTFDMETEFGVMRNIFETKLDRALGFKGSGAKNERIVLQSQFQESRQIQESGEQNMIKDGFFKRLLGRR